jgi:hypothetical protein
MASPYQRRRHVKAAHYRLILRRSVGWIARRFRISPRTVALWSKLAPTYDMREAEVLRRRIAGGVVVRIAGVSEGACADRP